jgi:mycofactocin system creatininase family protein
VALTTPADLGSHTWPQVEQRRTVLVVVPLGACEQHGPHLPLATDTLIATALAQHLAAARGDVVVAPAIGIAASGEHDGFAGTLSVGTSVLTAVLVELVRSAGWATGVVVVNGHGGNADAVAQAEVVWRSEGRPVLAWSPSPPPHSDVHAGRLETSVMLALHGERVGDDRPVGRTEALATLWPVLRRDGVRAVSPSGVLGDATGASAVEGTAVLAAWGCDLVDAVAQRWPPARPT